MQNQEQLFYSLFKIPQIEGTNVKKKVICGLIDASGSMGSYWAAMVKFWNQTIAESAEFLITFSHIAKLEENTILSQSLQKHGGGMTNIYSAFEKLQQRLMKVDQNASITIIFISDGQDTTNGEAKLREKMKKLSGGQGRDITMLCLGIQSGFPTKMAMDIRQLYHTGDQKIPAIYLIQYASQKAFFNKFQTMSNCFKVSNEVSLSKESNFVKQYPWEKDGLASLKEGQWIMVSNKIEKIELIYNKSVAKEYTMKSLQNFSLDELVDCFRGWVQKVQLLSMDNKAMKQTMKIAILTAEIMKNYALNYEKIHKINILSQKPNDGKQSFRQRAANLAVKNVGCRIKWFIDEMQIIGKGVGIGQLSQYQAAKRIGIGTITGKYHQKALALKGITVKDFQKIKQEFTQIFKNTTLSQKPSNQQVSIFTLQNQKQIFQEKDFLQGLKICGNQFDLVQSFPIVGYSLKIKRYDGSMINPWKVRVLQLAKTHNSIDSVYLANNNNKYELSIGQGKFQQINAVLPLFSEEDIEMSELFNSKLFKLAVSFMVVQNIDTFHEEAYLALLASTFAFLIKQPNSQWRNNLLNLIYTSLKVTYWRQSSFKQTIMKSLSNPYLLFTDKGKEDHTDISKVMLLVYFIGKEKLLEKQELRHFIDLVMVHYVQKTYVQNQFKLSKIAKLEIKMVKNKEITIQKQQKPLKEFNTLKNFDELKSIVNQEVSKYMNVDEMDIEFDPKIFLHNDQQRRITYDHIKRFYEMSSGQKLQNFNFLYYFGHVLRGKSQEIYREPVLKDIQFVKKKALEKIDVQKLDPSQSKKVKQLKSIIEDKYTQVFQKCHFGITPFKMDFLKDQCKKIGTNITKLNFNPTTGMINNACMSPLCKYYLQPMKGNEFQEHMKLWKRTLPVRFHSTVVLKLKEKRSIDQIYTHLISSKLVLLKNHRKSKQQVIGYIQLIKKSLET